MPQAARGDLFEHKSHGRRRGPFFFFSFLLFPSPVSLFPTLSQLLPNSPLKASPHTYKEQSRVTAKISIIHTPTMAMNILTPTMASSTFEPAENTTSQDNSSTGGATGLRRNNTLKAYLANKNKLKERQAINVIVDPSLLEQNDEHDDLSSPQQQRSTPPGSPFGSSNAIMSPVGGKRIDTDLDAIDREKKTIEDQLALITQQLNNSPPSSPAAESTDALSFSLFPGMSTLSKDELTVKRANLLQELDVLMKRRRELLQSWARDYKSLKRSGSLANKKQDDVFWVTTA